MTEALLFSFEHHTDVAMIYILYRRHSEMWTKSLLFGDKIFYILRKVYEIVLFT